jgi:hypothetical protein
MNMDNDDTQRTQSDEGSVLMAFHGQMMRRMQHFETLVLGLATLGMVGWGFLYASPYFRFEEVGRGMISTLFFGTIFSGMIASAFSALYMARNVFNIVLLELEAKIGGGLRAHLGFFGTAGRFARAIFYLTALFIPTMSGASLLFSIRPLFNSDVTPSASSGEILLLKIIWSISVLAVLTSLTMNVFSIERVFRTYRRLVGNN